MYLIIIQPHVKSRGVSSLITDKGCTVSSFIRGDGNGNGLTSWSRVIDCTASLFGVDSVAPLAGCIIYTHSNMHSL